MIKDKCTFDYWLFGHYHDNRVIDERFVLQWEQMVQLTL
jgi:DNA repair exonuclease SbcCD nuclease subunit